MTSTLRELLQLAWPIVVSRSSQTVIGVSDALMADTQRHNRRTLRAGLLAAPLRHMHGQPVHNRQVIFDVRTANTEPWEERGSIGAGHTPAGRAVRVVRG